MVIALVEKKPFGVAGVGRNTARMEYVHSASKTSETVYTPTLPEY
jgi:hypothetical protein